MRKILAIALVGLFSSWASADALSDFQKIVDGCRVAYEQRGSSEVLFAPIASAWLKREYRDTKVVYDVRKTDSLVSPVVAQMDVSEQVKAGRASDRSAAEVLDVSSQPAAMQSYRVTMALRNEAWQLVDIRYSAKIDDDDAPRTIVIDRKTLGIQHSPLALCIP